jgi:phage-related minor tail protein
MDIDRAMKNPASTFTTPEALSESSELTADQKRKVLLQWKDQLQQLQAADDEGMQQNDAAASTTDDLLERVTSILSRIDADLKRSRTPDDF